MKRPNSLLSALTASFALLLAACGSATTTGGGSIVVNGLAPGQTILCASSQGGPGGRVVVLGTGFLSEHGDGIEVTWTAVTGTPFEAGTTATTQTAGIIVSDSRVEVDVPDGFGTFDVTITVTLPGGNSGTSQPQSLSIGGILVGPFAQTDTIPGTIGNVPTTVAAPGVLANDIPASCASEDEIERKPADPASTAAVEDFVVVTPPAGFEADATPGMPKMTNLGGVVVIQADGSFTYSPPVGVTDTSDFFFYWMQEGTRGPDRGFVSLPISGQVWFIDSNSDGANNGHFDNPYQSIADFMDQQGDGATFPGAGDTIFIYSEQGNDPYDGFLGLLNDQVLLGEGFGLTIDTREIVPAGTRPVLVNSQFAAGEVAGDIVIGLADRNTIRGLAIEAPNRYGMFGFDVDGPVLIDDVSISDCNETGIRIEGGSGRIQVGDPMNTNIPTFSISGCGTNGIQIAGNTIPVLEGGLATGATLVVFNGMISNMGRHGIDAFDVNVELSGGEYDNCNIGVYHEAFFGTCTFTADGVGSGTNTPHRFRGIVLDPFDGAGINATISNCTTISNEQALYVSEFGSALVRVALSGNTWENLVTGNVPAVLLQGGEVNDILVTQMDQERYTGNGSGGGLICDGVLFDADPDTGGAQVVSTTTLDFGNSAGARVEDTAMQLYSCSGSLSIGTLTIWQVLGNPAGYVNFGPLTLTITTEVIDVTSP